jgi:hypothetical protein
MWLNRLFVIGLLAAYAAPLQSTLSDQQVDRAIARADKLTDRNVCVGQTKAGEFSVCLQGPEQRIGVVATLAKQAHRRFRLADVTADLKAQTWTVVVRPGEPALIDGRPVRSPLAQDLSLELRGHPEVSLPHLNAVPVPVSWDNAIGVSLKGQGLRTTIDPSTLPGGDLDVVIITDGDQRRYVLSQSSRAKIH